MAKRWVAPDSIYFNAKSADFAFLSNMHPCAVVLGGVRYPSAEHAFQCAKMLKFNRTSVASALLQLDSPFNVKKKAGKRGIPGARLSPEDLSQWDGGASTEAMLDVLRAKFSPGGELAARLVATGSRTLVEKLNVFADKTWGVAGKGCIGENRLGVLLMRVRDDLRQSSR
jgi:ribA/ribD-fused uncharacterized protein